MFGISGEHLLVLGIILLIFGPRRLPELGNTLGKAIKNFKDAISGIEEAKFRKLEDEQRANPNPSTNPTQQETPSQGQSTSTTASTSAPNSTPANTGSSDTPSSSTDPGNKS